MRQPHVGVDHIRQSGTLNLTTDTDCLPYIFILENSLAGGLEHRSAHSKLHNRISLQHLKRQSTVAATAAATNPGDNRYVNSSPVSYM